MDGFGLQPRGLGHALGGPAGGSAELEAQLLGRQDAQDRIDHSGLAHPGPTGDHQHLAGQGQGHRLLLAGGQLQAEALLHPGQGLGRVDRTPGRLPLRQLPQRLRDAAFIPVQVGQENGRLPRQAVSHHRALTQLQLQGGLDQGGVEGNPAAGGCGEGGAVCPGAGGIEGLGSGAGLWSDRRISKRPLHRQQVSSEFEQLRRRQAAVALAAGLQQGVVDAGPQANGGGRFDAEAGGDRVGGAKADAADVAGQAIGVLRHHLHRLVPIGLEDPHRPGGADTMAVQEHHDFAHHLLIGPGLGDAAGPHLADARHLPQPLGRLLDHREHLRPEGHHQLAGIDGANAADHAGAEVFLDALGGGGWGGAQKGGLELLAVLPAVHPGATHGDPFTGADLGGVAHHCHQITVPPGLDPQHAEAALGVVEGDPLNRAGQHFGGLAGGRLAQSSLRQWRAHGRT